MTPWSLLIKTVGSQESSSTANNGDGNFRVSVCPDDSLNSLYNRIEDVTGLKASQQRLIYRGRIINHNEKQNPHNNRQEQPQTDDVADVEAEKKIKDVVGLSDGHTIHLVPKPATASSSSTSSFSSQEENSSRSGTNSSSANGTAGATSSSNEQPEEISGTASLLAALLGLGVEDDDDDNNNTSSNDQESSEARRSTPSVRRLPRSGRRSTRRTMNYRLTAEDPRSPEPGSMEPVRQGLMTLCTMMDSFSTISEEERDDVSMEQLDNEQQKDNNSSSGHPLDANRTWYRGQWIDCLDTINQWLEATIVDIVRVEDVLPSRKKRGGRRHRRNKRPQVADAAVSANDIDGRMRLLLEPCDPDDDNEESVTDNEELAGFQERDNNDGVQLLLIHYNGWPHRWDEWIRSDSERIRPFRTRTRHSSSSPYMSPSPQSVFHAAPSTYIKDEDDKADRSALLPELHRAISSVNSLLTEAIPANLRQTHEIHTSSSGTTRPTSDLPWLDHGRGVTGNHSHEDIPPLMEGDELFHSEDILHLNRDSITPAAHSAGSKQNTQLSRQQLEALAPLIDRLGRTLTDAAPHVAALAASLPEEEPVPSDAQKSLTQEDEVNEREDTLNSSSGGGLLSLLSRESRRRARLNNGEESASTSTALVDSVSAEEEDRINPDHVDFVNGMVNTFRGEDRNTRRERSEDGTSLLGAYLAAASLSNLTGGGGGASENNDTGGGVSGVRLRPSNGGTGTGGTGGGGGGGGVGGGGGGGGIDIHIHAIVTGPGVGPNGMGLAMLGGGGGGGGGTIPSPLRSPGISRSSEAVPPMTPITPLSENHDDTDLFSDLYSENPQPVDPHGTPTPNIDNENDPPAIESTETSIEADDDTGNPNPPNSNTPNSNICTSSGGSVTTSSEQSSTQGRPESSTRRRPVRRLFRRLGRRSSSSKVKRSNSRNGV